MGLVQHWPLFGIRITTPRLELRVPTDADHEELIEVARSGVHDPEMMPFVAEWTDWPSPEFEWGMLKYWWRCRATLSPESWILPFVVVHDGRLVGVQELTSTEFPILRNAETGSWLGQRHQGKGIGGEMRAAIVHFGFECLGAEAITSTAFHDNPASQAVSRRTGYLPNGTSSAVRRGERAELARFLLTREQWQRTKSDLPITVTGFDPCRPILGLEND